MAEPRLLDTKVPTKNPQLRRADRHARPQGKARRTARGTLAGFPSNRGDLVMRILFLLPVLR